MTARLLLVATATVVLAGLSAAPSSAATLYGGGSVPASTAEPPPLFLVAVDNGRASIVGFSGGSCTNGRAGYGRFATHRFALRRKGRFAIKGSFKFIVPGGVTTGSFRIRGRVRASSGLATGVASVRLRFPSSTGKLIRCRGLKRAFRARNPAAGKIRSRGPFYGVTSQGLPILVRPAPDSSALAPVAMMATMGCAALGPVQSVPYLRVAATAPGVYAKSGVVTSNFIPALGSPTGSIPLGTYTYTSYDFQAQIASGRATGSIGLSSKVGNAQKILIDTCASPPITFTAVP